MHSKTRAFRGSAFDPSAAWGSVRACRRSLAGSAWDAQPGGDP